MIWSRSYILSSSTLILKQWITQGSLLAQDHPGCPLISLLHPVSYRKLGTYCTHMPAFCSICASRWVWLSFCYFLESICFHFMSMWVLSACMWMQYMVPGACEGQKKVLTGCLLPDVRDDFEPPWELWSQGPTPLWEQQEFLTLNLSSPYLCFL